MDEHSVLSSRMHHNGRKIRPICSFVRRQGRITKNQKLALEKYWNMLGIEYKEKTINMVELFNHNAPIILEIGFGMGHSLIQMAKYYPEKNFLGIEVYKPGIGSCLSAVNKFGIKNIRIIWHDAIEVLQNMIPDHSLSTVQLFFPDPWHKKKHKKRRIIQKSFVQLVIRKLNCHGIIKILTDVESYAKHILYVMNSFSEYKNIYKKLNYFCDKTLFPVTKFEKRAKNLNHKLWKFMFKKC